MYIALCGAGLAASILIAYRRKLNIGVFAAVSAYLIGSFMMGIPAKELVGMISVHTLFSIIGITFFYGIAIENGTMELLTCKILYRMQKKVRLLPGVLALLAFLISGAGLGAGPTIALTGPMAMRISAMSGMNLLITILSISVGASCGSNFPWSQGGVVIEGVLRGLEGEAASGYMNAALGHTLAANLLALLLVILVLGRRPMKKLELHKGEAFLPEQRKTLILMAMAALLVIVPKVMGDWLGVEWMAQAAKFCDVGFVSLLGVAIASIGKLVDQQAVIRNRIPWSVILMIGGISILIGVLKKAGVIEVLSAFVTGTIPRMLIPSALCLGAAFMSLFSGATTVVVPTLFAVVPGIASSRPETTGLCYAAVLLGACMGGISPISNGGSMLLGSCDDKEMRSRLAGHMCILMGVTVAVAVVYLFIIQILFYPS